MSPSLVEGREKKRDMSATQTEKVGFGKNVLELVEQESAVLKREGYGADEIHAILSEKV